MRLISGYMAAFGMTPDEIHTLCTDNPERLLAA
jgi:predicted metal-dependent phosphotriesterase family hydrolase